jgi:MSHA pilin protein MshA
MKRRIKNRKGFTLIEIIAVLVILGILAAVAIPKYLDLQDQAEIRAAEGAVASAQSRLSMAYSKYLLEQDGQKPTAAQVVTEASGTGGNCGVEGDYTVACTASGNIISITAIRTGITDATLQATGTWTLPSDS